MRQRLADADGEAHATHQELRELRDWRQASDSAAAAAETRAETTLVVVTRELLAAEAELVGANARAMELGEKLATENRHLARKLSRVSRETEQRVAEEKAALELKLQETERRAEAKLKAERTRLAVRYSNAPKTQSARRGEQSPHQGEGGFDA